MSSSLDNRVLFDVSAKLTSFRILPRVSKSDPKADNTLPPITKDIDKKKKDPASTVEQTNRWIKRGFSVRLVWGGKKDKETAFTVAGSATALVPASHSDKGRRDRGSRSSHDESENDSREDSNSSSSASGTAAVTSALTTSIKRKSSPISGSPLALVYECKSSFARAQVALGADSLFLEISTTTKYSKRSKVIAPLQPVVTLYDIATGPQNLCLNPIALSNGRQCQVGIRCIMTQITPHASMSVLPASEMDGITCSGLQLSTPRWSQVFVQQQQREWSIELSKLDAMSMLEASIDWTASRTQLPLTVVRQQHQHEQSAISSMGAAGYLPGAGTTNFVDSVTGESWLISWKRFPIFWQWTSREIGTGNTNSGKTRQVAATMVVGAPLPSAETVARFLDMVDPCSTNTTGASTLSSSSHRRPFEFALRGCLPESLALLPEPMRTYEKLRSIASQWRRLPASLQSMTPSQHAEFIARWTQDYVAESARLQDKCTVTATTAASSAVSGASASANNGKLNSKHHQRKHSQGPVINPPAIISAAAIKAEIVKTVNANGGCAPWTVGERLRRQRQLQYERDQIALVIGSSWNKITSVASEQQQMTVRWKIDRGIPLSSEEMSWIMSTAQ
jgi:hypothetical protein